MTKFPSIEKPWLKYYKKESINSPLPKMTVYDNIYQHNRSCSNDIAIYFFGRRITYDTLFKEIDATAKALLQYGVHNGDRIICCLSNVPEAVYCLCAASKIGAITNMINPLFDTEQQVARINESEATLLISLDVMYPLIAAAVEKTCVKDIVIIPVTNSLTYTKKTLFKISEIFKRTSRAKIDQKYKLWKNFISEGNAYSKKIVSIYEKDRPLVMVYSSGTTGASKGIVLTNDGLNATIHQYEVSELDIRRGMKMLQITPLWFSTGIAFSMLMPLCLGMSIVLEPEFSTKAFARDIKKYRPNFALITPSVWVEATKSKYFKNIDLSFMTYPVTGGEMMLPATEIYLNNFFKAHGCKARIQKGWGMCELGAVATATDGKNEKLSTTGVPLSHTTVSIFDLDTDQELTYNQWGEIRAFTPSRMIYYYKNPVETDKFFKTDELGRVWGCSGDLGYMDEDGDVYVLGRASDCFTAKTGQRVFMFEIESKIMESEYVESCKAVALYSDTSNTCILVANLVLKKGTNGEQAVFDIDKALKCALPEEKVPQGYKIRDHFDIKPSGKRDVEVLQNDFSDYLVFENEKLVTMSFNEVQ